LLTKEIKLIDGCPHCRKTELIFWGFNPGRNRFKFRCPLALGKITSCKFSKSCSTSSYGRTFYLHPTDDTRLFPEIPRFTKEWKTLYNNRSSIERTNSELKEQHRLKNIRVRTINKIKSHVYISCIALILKRFFDFFDNPLKYSLAPSYA
jgi:hypothetical protein